MTIIHFSVLSLRVCVRPCECSSVFILPYSVSLCFLSSVAFNLLDMVSLVGLSVPEYVRCPFSKSYVSNCTLWVSLHFYFFFFIHLNLNSKNSFIYGVSAFLFLFFNFTDFSFYEIVVLKCISFHSIAIVYSHKHNCIVEGGFMRAYVCWLPCRSHTVSIYLFICFFKRSAYNRESRKNVLKIDWIEHLNSKHLNPFLSSLASENSVWVSTTTLMHYNQFHPLFWHNSLSGLWSKQWVRENLCVVELITLGRHLTYRRHHPMYHTLVLVLLSLRMRLFNGFIFRNTGNVSGEG